MLCFWLRTTVSCNFSTFGSIKFIINSAVLTFVHTKNNNTNTYVPRGTRVVLYMLLSTVVLFKGMICLCVLARVRHSSDMAAPNYRPVKSILGSSKKFLCLDCTVPIEIGASILQILTLVQCARTHQLRKFKNTFSKIVMFSFRKSE